MNIEYPQSSYGVLAYQYPITAHTVLTDDWLSSGLRVDWLLKQFEVYALCVMEIAATTYSWLFLNKGCTHLN